MKLSEKNQRIHLIKMALINGEKSGKAKKFDNEQFKLEMHNKLKSEGKLESD